MFSINSSFSCNGVSEEKDKQAFANYQRILALLAEASAQPGVEVAFDIKMHVSSAASEHPPLPASPPPEREEVAASEEEEDSACNICGDLPQWVEMEKERGICCTCAEHMDEGLKYYTEDFAHASEHGKDALHLFVLRQRADNCRDTICAAAGSYDGDLEAHEASVQEKLLNKRAAECLARLPPSFAPWWKDTWSHEKWCQVYAERKAAGWPLASADVPIVQRLAAAAVAKEDKMHEMEKAHAKLLENIERARKEDLEAVEARHRREMTKAVAEAVGEKVEAARTERAMAAAMAEERHKREMAEKDKRYKEALAPLLGVRDKMIAECEKKVEEADRRAYAMGYAFADQKWNPVYKAVCEELELVRNEGANHQAAYIRLFGERDEALLAQADLRKELAAAQKELRQQIEEDKQMVQRHLKEIAKENAEMTAWETERLREENKDLQKKHEALLELVEPSVKLMKSNPELFGGEARGGAPAPGAASPRPPPIVRLPPIKEEDKERGLNFLRSLLVAPSRPCLLVESPTSALPGIVEAEASCSQTEGMCMALTEEQYKEMFGADRCLLPPSPPASPLLVPEQPPPCGAGGCIDCPLPAPLPASLPAPLPASLPAPVAAPLPASLPDTTPVCCVDCGKPKPNYNHPNWPSPITKRFAKHLAKHSGLRSPWRRHDPKTIKTHEDALEYIAKRVNISVENLLGWTRKQYQTTYDPWTLVEGPSKFNMGTAPATWWC